MLSCQILQQEKTTAKIHITVNIIVDVKEFIFFLQFLWTHYQNYYKPFCWLGIMLGSESRVSVILSQMMSTSLSNTALTLMLSLADVSKNSSPKGGVCISYYTVYIILYSVYYIMIRCSNQI